METNVKKEEVKDEEQELIFKTIEKIKNPETQSKLIYVNQISQEREKIAEEADKEQKQLMDKYNKSNSDIYNSINDIVFGKNNNITLTEEEEKKYGINSSDSNTNTEIKDYWNKVILNANFFYFDDEEKKIFNHLTNITYENLENGFKISFIFEENEYFEPNILWKEYYYNKQGEEINSIKASEINWKKEELKNKINSKKSNKKDKKENKNEKNNFSEMNFFSIFKSIDNLYKKEKEVEKDDEDFEEELIQDEIDFFKNDLFKNQLEYYLNIMDICEEGDEGEFGEEKNYEDDYYDDRQQDDYYDDYNEDNYNDYYYDNNNRGRRNYGRGNYRRGRGGYYNDYNNYDDYNDNYNYNNYNYDNYDNYNYNNYRGGNRGYGRGGRGRYNNYNRNYY